MTDKSLEVIGKLAKQLKIYKKALDIAIKSLHDEDLPCDCCIYYGDKNDLDCDIKDWEPVYCYKGFKEWCLKQAKEKVDEC